MRDKTVAEIAVVSKAPTASPGLRRSADTGDRASVETRGRRLKKTGGMKTLTKRDPIARMAVRVPKASWNHISQTIAAALLLSFCLSGCSDPSAPPPPPTPEVAVMTVQPRQVVVTTELPGRTSAFRIAEITPQVNGLLEKRLFEEGSDVKAGQFLYEIDPAPYQAAYDSATANLAVAKENLDHAQAVLETSNATLKRHHAVLELAKTNLRRYETLAKSRAVSAMQRDQAAADVDVAGSALRAATSQVNCDQQGVETAEAAMKQAEAGLRTVKINLGYTKMTAPISGRIGRSAITEGAIVTAYQPTPLATIQQLDPLYVNVPQSTVELNRLKRSLANGHMKDNGTDKVKIILEDGTVYPLEGSLKFRDVTVDPTTGSVILRIVVPNPESVLLPGMFVRAIIDEGIQEQALLIPQQAVSRNLKGDPMALIVDAEGKARHRGLVVDRAIGDQWLVTSGLAQGDRVIVEGMQKVRPGMAVRLVPFKADLTNAAKLSTALQAATKLN